MNIHKHNAIDINTCTEVTFCTGFSVPSNLTAVPTWNTD